MRQAPPRRAVRGHLVTALSILIVAGAVALVALAYVGTGGTPERKRPAPSSAALLHVGGRACSDSGTVADARDAATPWCTPAQALRAAPGGAVIQMAPGTYGPLKLSGRTPRAAPVTLRGASGGATVIRGMDVRGSGGLRFEQLAFTRPASIADGTDIALDSNDLRSAGIVVTVSRGITLTRNHIHDLHGEDRGIYFRGNLVPGRPDNEDIVVRGNRIERLDHDGIAFYNGYRNVRVEGNTISRAVQPTTFDKHTDGMQFMGGRNLTVRDNVVRDSSKEGMIFKDGEPSLDLVVEGNLVFDIAGPGIQVYSAPGARLAHNTVWSTRFGSFLGNDPAVPGATRAVLTGNVFDRLTLLAPEVVARAAGNVFGAGSTVGRPAFRGRPNFSDAAAGDLRIERGRPGAGLRSTGPLPGAQRAAG